MATIKLLCVALGAAAIGLLGWAALRPGAAPPRIEYPIASLSYNFHDPKQELSRGEAARVLARVEADMALLSGVTQRIRVYASTGLFKEVPRLAAKYGLGVTLGAWVEAGVERTRDEIEAAIALANQHPNVRSVVVGNETILRNELTVDELIAHLRYVRQRVRVAVTTGETWDVWLEHPQLANEVDYIAAHVLPYWERLPAEVAVAHALERYRDLRAAFPGKRVVLAEFGWPSHGSNNHDARTSQVIQAKVLREFLREAHREGLDYNLIEAFDQPWKTDEGSVGPYWGLYDAERHLKFAAAGTVRERYHWVRAALAVGIGLAGSLVGLALLGRRPRALHALTVAAAAQVLAIGVAMALLYPLENYLNAGSAVAWGMGFALMLPLTAMTFLRLFEVADVTLGPVPLQLLRAPLTPPPDWQPPLVSIHIPACREEPGMLIATLNSVAALRYPRFEVLVIVNNTPEDALWRPVEAHCRRLGARFQFVHLERVDGYKAGALSAALPWMAPEAEVIALIDADYTVHPEWLAALVPTFADPSVGMVQAPQDHRDGGGSMFRVAMNAEYAGFFDIGMVQRNEANAIITHGTMLLVRRRAFEEAGGWSADTITEDTEFGLRLLRAGWRAAYTNRRYGWGVLPDTFRAFQTQRDRWAYGAVQIIRKHWRAMLPGERSLSAGQKFHFVSGWSHWLADAFGVLAALLNLLWVPMILFVGVLIPMLPFTVPILAMFAVNVLHCALLYRMRVRLPLARIAGAALAAMSLQLTVAVAVAKGLFSGGQAFRRTEKGGLARLLTPSGRARRAGVVEGAIGAALALSAVALWVTNLYRYGQTELYVFALTLAVQGLPFLAAPAMAWLEHMAPLPELAAPLGEGTPPVGVGMA